MVKTAVVQTSSTDGQNVVSAKCVDWLQLRQLKALNGQHLKEMLQEPGMNSLPERTLQPGLHDFVILINWVNYMNRNDIQRWVNPLITGKKKRFNLFTHYLSNLFLLVKVWRKQQPISWYPMDKLRTVPRTRELQLEGRIEFPKNFLLHPGVHECWYGEWS